MGMRLRSDEVVVKRAKNLLRLSRHLGFESAADLVLELIFLRWELAHRPLAWNALIEFLDAGGTARSKLEGELAALLEERVGVDLGIKKLAELGHVFDFIDRHSTATPEVRSDLSALFEEVLAQKAATVSRAGQEFGTQEHASELMAQLVAGADSLLDPACGEGAVLSRAAAYGASQIYGVELVNRVARIARMRLALVGVESKIVVDNWLLTDPTSYTVAAVVLEPPFNMRVSHGERLYAKTDDLERVSDAGDLIWMHSALAALAETGIAAVLMPISSTSGKLGDNNLSTLYARGHVVAIIQLPAGLLRHTGMSSCIWLLCASPRSDRKVLMIDTSPMAVRGQGSGPLLEPPLISAVAECVKKWRTRSEPPQLPGYIAKVATEEDIALKKRLEPRRFLDSPPTEEETRPSAAAHLLAQIRLKNFKAFGGTETAPLAPLTLIYGKNSAGKSSIIQSLLLLKQSMAAPRLVTQGEWADLGIFATAVHRHQTSRSIRVGVSFGSPPGALVAPLVASSRLMRSIDLTFSEDELTQEVEHIAGVGFGEYYAAFASKGGDSVNDCKFELSLDGLQQLLSAAAEPGMHYPRTKAPITRANLSVVPLILRRNGEKSVLVAGKGILPTGELLTEFSNPNGRQESTARSYIQRGLALSLSVTEELRAILANLTYLGPLRQSPKRYYARSAEPGVPSEPNVAMKLFDNVSEQKQITHWLNRLGIAYELEVLGLGTATSREIVGDLVAITLVDSRSGIKLSPADVGFGISQVLPILVELSARQQSVVCIEQPEIHLHPALQAEMADILIESTEATGRANQVLVETHSEHLILRVQRRIREGSLDPQQVSVLYVDQAPNGDATVKKLRLDAHGDFIDEWPNGFFDDRLTELFGSI